MTTVWVTGAKGFLGRYVCRCFHEGKYTVCGMGRDRKEVQPEIWGMDNWYAGDICEPLLDSISTPPDVVIHCAGGSSVQKSLENPQQDFISTVFSTSIMLDYLRRKYPKSVFIFVSSAAVYGSTSKAVIDESMSLAPISPYGQHKKIGEELCASYGREYGINVAIVRFFSLYGIGLRKQLLWDAAQKALHGDAVFYGSGDEERDWLHVLDAAHLLKFVSEKASPDAPVFNGASGEGHTVESVVNSIFRYLSCKHIPVFNKILHRGNPHRLCADINRILSTGWRPYVDFEFALSEYVNWVKDVHHV